LVRDQVLTQALNGEDGSIGTRPDNHLEPLHTRE
jgi:hypothetical protein